MIDAIVNIVMKKIGLDRDHINKVKEILDMLEFTKENGEDVIKVKVAEGVKVTIIRPENHNFSDNHR